MCREYITEDYLTLLRYLRKIFGGYIIEHTQSVTDILMKHKKNTNELKCMHKF